MNFWGQQFTEFVILVDWTYLYVNKKLGVSRIVKSNKLLFPRGDKFTLLIQIWFTTFRDFPEESFLGDLIWEKFTVLSFYVNLRTSIIFPLIDMFIHIHRSVSNFRTFSLKTTNDFHHQITKDEKVGQYIGPYSSLALFPSKLERFSLPDYKRSEYIQLVMTLIEIASPQLVAGYSHFF